MTAYPLASTLVLLAAVLAWSFGCAEPTAQRAPGRTAAEPAGATRVAAEEGERVQISGRWATAWASSELASDDARYGAAKAFDGDPATAWVEGVEGYGVTDGAGEVAERHPLVATGGGRPGESIHVRFDEPVTFEGVALRPGFLRSGRLYERNGVPAAIEVSVDGRAIGTYKLPYPMSLVFEGEGANGSDPRPDGCYHVAVGPYAAERLVVFQRPVRGAEMAVRLGQAGLGSAHEDTAVSEVTPIIQGALGPAGRIVGIIRNPRVSMEGADVQDLRGVSVSAYEVVDGGSELPPELPSPTDEGLPRPRFAAGDRGLTAREVYEAAAWNHLVGVGLLVESSSAGTKVTGGVSDSEGDGEWAEVRPQLQIGSEGQLRSAREVVSFGGAPGCPSDVSRLAPIPTATRARPATR